jgi:hypothetical protein
MRTANLRLAHYAMRSTIFATLDWNNMRYTIFDIATHEMNLMTAVLYVLVVFCNTLFDLKSFILSIQANDSRWINARYPFRYHCLSASVKRHPIWRSHNKKGVAGMRAELKGLRLNNFWYWCLMLVWASNSEQELPHYLCTRLTLNFDS